MQRTVLQAPCPYVFFLDLKSDDKVLISSGAKTQLGSLVGIPQATPEGLGVQSFVSKCRLVSPLAPVPEALSPFYSSIFLLQHPPVARVCRKPAMVSNHWTAVCRSSSASPPCLSLLGKSGRGAL